MRPLHPLLSSLTAAALVSLALGAASCSMGNAPSPTDNPNGPSSGDASTEGGPVTGDGGVLPDGGTGPIPFESDSPSVYVAKVKNVLVGLAPTDAEVKAVEADPAQLGALVDGWMKLPEYQTKMLRFFELAFQQTQVTGLDFENMLDQGQLQVGVGPAGPAMVQTLQESFARTMLSIAASGQPFTQAMSTQTYALTTALKVFYALTDVWQIDDSASGLHDAFAQANPTLNLYVTAAGPIPLAQTLNPSSPNYMHWYDPGVASVGGGAACQTDPLVFPARANTLYEILTGTLPGRKLGNGTSCPSANSTGQLQSSDFSDWTMVDIKQPGSSQATTAFYDLATLRGGTTLVLNRPYVGFFTTPAFFANWQTNASNQMRVTINQTFIVATGAQIDGTDPTIPTSTPGLDTVHAGAPCFGCHQLLDPSRSILASTFSWNYGTQLDPKYASQPGLFAFEGVQAPMKTVYDLGKTLASHPLVPQGWAEKLCYYVNSEACVTTDPAFQSLVDLFKSSSYSWDALVKALVISPITTHASSTLTATTNGEVVAVARRDHLCAAWNARLGFADICGLDAMNKPVAPASALAIVGGLPSDGYGRGSTAPVLPNQPSLFYRAGTENLCEGIAALVVDNKTPPPGAKTWSSAQPDAAITDFVNIVAGLPPSDARAAPLGALLQAHFASAKAVSGMSATSALQSTFVAACMTPSALSMGM